MRNYEILPLLAANYTFSGQSVSVQYANPGGEPVTVQMPIPDVSFRAAAPAGSESLDPYIAGRNLTLELNVQGDSSTLAAGDALVIEYSAEGKIIPWVFGQFPDGAPLEMSESFQKYVAGIQDWDQTLSEFDQTWDRLSEG